MSRLFSVASFLVALGLIGWCLAPNPAAAQSDDEAQDAETYRVNGWIDSGNLRDWDLQGFVKEEYRGHKVISRRNAEGRGGEARTTFQGPDGYYKVRVHYVDEPDGVSNLTLKVGDRTVGTWKFDGIVVESLRWKEFDGVEINNGQAITLSGNSGKYEMCRVMGVEILPSEKRETREAEPVEQPEFSGDLVPLAGYQAFPVTDSQRVPPFEPTFTGGRGTYLLHLSENSRFHLAVYPNYTGYDAGVRYTLTPVDGDEPLAQDELRSETSHPIHLWLEAQDAGLYELNVASPSGHRGNPQVRFDVPSVRPLDGNGRAPDNGFFFVPAGTEAVGVTLTGRAVVLDAEGDVLLDEWITAEERRRIAVPEGSDGQLWYYQGSLHDLKGVPRYVTTQPAGMLVPRETVPVEGKRSSPRREQKNEQGRAAADNGIRQIGRLHPDRPLGGDAPDAHILPIFSIAEDGEARAFIQIAEDAPTDTFSLANELSYYLHRMTGAHFEVRRTNDAEGPCIVLGTIDDFPELDVQRELDVVDGVADEAFLMTTVNGKVLLLGREQIGVSHATFAFLERLGCRWFFPGETWTVVPHTPTLRVHVHEKQAPDLAMRNIAYGSMNGYYTAQFRKMDWYRHTRMRHAVNISTGHSWMGLDRRKDFEEHPDWFALVDGERQPSKPCYGHPAVVQQAVDRALESAANGAKSISVSAPDGLGFCECEKCMDIAGIEHDTMHQIKRAWFGKRPDGTEVCVTSETIFRMANKVAKAVGEKYPDVTIGMSAYSGYSHPPSFDLEPNIYVRITTSYRRTPLSLEEQIDAFGDRGAILGIYHYYYIVVWSQHDHGPAKGVKMAQIQEEMPYFYENNVRGVKAEATNSWAATGANFYVASKLMWDVHADADAVYDDFLEKAFGAGADPMRRYYDRWQANTDETPEVIAAAKADLREAYELAKLESQRQRIAQLYAYIDWYGAKRAHQRAEDDEADAVRVNELAERVAGDWWRLYPTFLLHDTVSKDVNQPFYPGFSRQEIERRMAEDAGAGSR